MSVRRLLRLPLLAPYRLASDRSEIDADVQRWDDVIGVSAARRGLLAHTRHRHFRNLYYLRLQRAGGLAWAVGRALRVVYRPEPTLHLVTSEIGPGLFIQHGFATIVAAERIGANCWINQQVTIGWTEDGSPTLGDDVSVFSGAQVLGPVTLGDGCRVGAGAVVVRDVAPGATATGSPAHRSPR